MSKAALCATSTVSWAKVEGRQNLGDRGLALHHVLGDAVDRNTRPPESAALRVDQLLKTLLLEQLAVDTSGVAPIWMISSPSDGLRPVVSVSNTV
jgi:hypothetical protein